MTSPVTKRSASPTMGSRTISTSDVVGGNPEIVTNEVGGNHNNGATLAPPRVRPPARSNFDLEPNPFEHSFSSTPNVSQDTPVQEGTSGNSNSNHSDPVTNNAHNNGHDGNSNNAVNGQGKHGRDVKPMLPPLAALESPADHGFGSWGLASSLRSGPLSPAMLAGPASQQTPSLGLGAFDSSFVRTGLTPDVNRTGLTPLIGGPGGFPPPSPNTAALFALVNGTSSSGSMAANVAITPGTLNAITGVLGGHSMNGIHQPTSMNLDQQNHQLLDAAQQQQQQQQHQQQQQQQQHQQGGPYNPHDSYAHDSASHAISNAASALYLLSQQQNLQRHQNQSQGQVNPSAVSGIPQPDSPTVTANPSSLASTRRATKRKSVETPAPAPRGKKAKATNAVSTRGGSKRKSSKTEDFDEDMDDFDEDDEDDDMYMEGSMMPPGAGAGSRSNGTTAKSGGGSRKPETEEEKRKNFLERNRQAALKCRQRKKAWLTALQQKVEFLTAENERLAGALVTSKEEIARLSQAVVAQGGAPSALLSEQSPISGNAQNGVMGDGSSVTSERERRGSASGSSVGATHQQPVHVNVAIPNMPNGSQVNGNGGMGHAHSHSHSLPQPQQTQGRGHTRAHSHGHNHVPANGVTVGGRGYGY